MQVVDDYSSFGWVCFHHHKSKIVNRLKSVVNECKGEGMNVQFIRADNAGENKTPMEEYCRSEGITLKLTPSNTPQLNGRVE